jgi:hypothetical protein
MPVKDAWKDFLEELNFLNEIVGSVWKILLLIFAIFISLMAYNFSENGRYINYREGAILDTRTGSVYIPPGLGGSKKLEPLFKK